VEWRLEAEVSCRAMIGRGGCSAAGAVPSVSGNWEGEMTMQRAWHVARIVFGAWFLFWGVEYFTDLGIQPIGTTPLAREFTLALIHSHLFALVKAMEVAIGAACLANRFVPLAMTACLPITVVIVWWNLVLEPGLIEIAFGLVTPVLNVVLLWPFRDLLRPLLLRRRQPII